MMKGWKALWWNEMDGWGILIVLNPPYHLNCPGKQSQNASTVHSNRKDWCTDVPIDRGFIYHLGVSWVPIHHLYFYMKLFTGSGFSSLYDILCMSSSGCTSPELSLFPSPPPSFAVIGFEVFFAGDLRLWFLKVVYEYGHWYIYIYTDTHIYIYIQDACCCRKSTFHTCLATWDTTVVWESKG